MRLFSGSAKIASASAKFASASLARHARDLVARTSGAVAVETALLALPFLGVIFCCAEGGLDYYGQSSLDQVSHKISRQIMIGAVQKQNLDAQGFKALVCGMLPAVLSCTNLIYSVQTVPASFYALTTPQTVNGQTQYSLIKPSLQQSSNAYCPGQSNQYVVVQLLYVIPAITGIWSASSVTYNGRTVRVLSTTSVFRNEAFLNGTGPAC